MHDVLFEVTVTFALVTGTVAGLLALLTWEILRRTTVGRTVFVFTVAMMLFACYHAVLIVFGSEPPSRTCSAAASSPGWRPSSPC